MLRKPRDPMLSVSSPSFFFQPGGKNELSSRNSRKWKKGLREIVWVNFVRFLESRAVSG
jgi:hypothetical protein